MASPSDTPSAADPTSTSRPTTAHAAPVEMASLPPAAAIEPVAATPTPAHTTETPAIASSDTPAPPATTQAPSPQETAQSTESTAAAAKSAPPADLNRTETEAIGPSTDTPAANPDSSNGPVVVIMLLLTTGARHPYKIDEKYLKKRSVEVEDMDPYNISVYTLKELIWRDWREGECFRWILAYEPVLPAHQLYHSDSILAGTARLTCPTEWEPRPTSPSSIRLIHFGRMLDDKAPLKGKHILHEQYSRAWCGAQSCLFGRILTRRRMSFPDRSSQCRPHDREAARDR